MIARLRAIARRLSLVDRVALAYAVSYLVWVAVHTPGTVASGVIADAAFLPLGLVLGWLCSRNARMAGRLGLGWRTQVAWSLLAAAAITLWISGNAWSYFVALTGPASTPGWIDGLEHLQLSLTIAACLAFPGRGPLAGSRIRFWLDVALVFVAAGVIAFHYGTGVVAALPNLGGLNLVIVRAALDWGVFFTLAVGVVPQARPHHPRRSDLPPRRQHLRARRATGSSRPCPDLPVGRARWTLLWFGAWMLKWTAARYAWHSYRRHHEARLRVVDEGSAHHTAALPHVVVAAAFGLLIYQVLAGPQTSIPIFAFSAVTLAGLLLVRQVAELRENRRLFRIATRPGSTLPVARPACL